MMNWLSSLFRRTPPPSHQPRELVFVSYLRADQMLRENVGWKLAREEDRNREVGFVFLERPVSQRSDQS